MPASLGILNQWLANQDVPTWSRTTENLIEAAEPGIAPDPCSQADVALAMCGVAKICERMSDFGRSLCHILPLTVAVCNPPELADFPVGEILPAEFGFRFPCQGPIEIPAVLSDDISRSRLHALEYNVAAAVSYRRLERKRYSGKVRSMLRHRRQIAHRRTTMPLTPYVEDQIWLCTYPVRLAVQGSRHE